MPASENFKQWTVQRTDEDYKIYNLDPETGKKRFYEVISGQYGQPLIVAEPDLAFDPPALLNYVDSNGNETKPVERIAGIICSDGKRFSLTNAETKGIKIETREDGAIMIAGEIWWINVLFSKDKNRIINYDAYLIQEKPEKVKILELADLMDFFKF